MAFFFRRVKPKDMEIQIDVVVGFVDESDYEKVVYEDGATVYYLKPTMEQEVMQDIADLPGPREWPSP